MVTSSTANYPVDSATESAKPPIVKNTNHHIEPSYNRERESPARTPAVQAYFDTYPSQTLDADQVKEINDTVTDIKRWREVLHYWKMNGHRPQSLGKMLDRYRSGRTIQDDRPNPNRSLNGSTHLAPARHIPTDPLPEPSKPTNMARLKEIHDAGKKPL